MTRHRKRRHESGTPEKEEEEGATEELKAFIQEKTGEAVTEIKKALDQRIEGIEDSLNFAYESITVTSQKVNSLEKDIKDVYVSWQEMNGRIAQLERHAEEMEKQRRRSQLIFAGQDLHIPEKDERLTSAITALIDRHLDLEVSPGEIAHVRRLPKRRLLVKFASDEKGSLRDMVYRAKAKLKGHRIFINENLTPMRQAALNFLLHERREGRLSTVHTRGGEVFFAVTKDDEFTRVRSREEAEHVLRIIGRPAAATAAAPPRPLEPGAAPAAVPPRPLEHTIAPAPDLSRAPGRAGGLPVGADSPFHGERAGAGESAALTPTGRREDRPQITSRRQTPAAPMSPSLPGPHGPGSPANCRGGEGAGGTLQGRAQPAETGPSPGGPSSGRDTARPSVLASPLADRPRGADMDTGGDGRQETDTMAGGTSGPGDVTASSVHLDSTPTEVRGKGQGKSVLDWGMGKGNSSGRALGGEGGERRTSSVPPGQRSGYEPRGELGRAGRHLSPAGETRSGEGAAGSRSRPAGASTQSGMTGDIRSFFR